MKKVTSLLMALILSVTILMGSIPTVSYTHLDVYKRQSLFYPLIFQIYLKEYNSFNIALFYMRMCK